MADRGGARVRMLAFFTLIGAAMTAALYFVGAGRLDRRPRSSIRSPASASGAASSSTTRCWSTSRSPRSTTSSPPIGYSLGYAGGGLLLLAECRDGHGARRASASRAPRDAVRIAFPMVGVWWLLFTVPLLLWVREEKPARALRCRRRRRAPAGANCARRLREVRKLPAARRGSCSRTGSTSTA